MFAILIGILGLAAGIGILAGWSYSGPSFTGKGGNRHLSLDHIFNGTFRVDSVGINWVKEGELESILAAIAAEMEDEADTLLVSARRYILDHRLRA